MTVVSQGVTSLMLFAFSQPIKLAIDVAKYLRVLSGFNKRHETKEPIKRII